MVIVSQADVLCAPTSRPCAGADPSGSSAWDFSLEENTGSREVLRDEGTPSSPSRSQSWSAGLRVTLL